ncbi:MAG: ATPase [Rhizobiales bacterium]|nr:ATPase [Hyphomicrobiales bacterium]
MNIGSLLVAKGLASAQDVERAISHQRANGGRIGDSLVALGILAKEQIDEVLMAAPQMPTTVAGTGIDHVLLLELLIKGMYTENIETASQLARVTKLSNTVVDQLLKAATDRKLVQTLASATGENARSEIRLTLTRAGREWAADALSRGQYFGPAPVSLEAYQERIQLQRITNEVVSRDKLVEAFSGFVIPDRFLDRLGPAVNSGNAILIYGPAGNGKTTIAEIVGKVFENIIYVPHCVEINGEIMKVFDPTVHRVVDDTPAASGLSGLRRSRLDPRWVACHRPMVVTGGELTIEMLDLKFNPIAKFYEAPLHIKALNGTFLIDDFGRQRAKPEEILNRWIVPLNSRVDYLALHTGKTAMIPFDEVVIFSTNLHPNDLMDPAFQRRISYKLETVEPPEDLFREVFKNMAAKNGLQLANGVIERVIAGVRSHDAPLAYFQPKFVIEQVLASCKFRNMAPRFTPDNIDDALANLFVKAAESKMFGVKRS